MTVEEQIKELTETVKCRLAPSKVHGVGVHTIRDIKKGEKLHCLIETPLWCTIPFDKLTLLPDEIRQLILDRWSPVVNGAPFLSPNHDAIMINFMNHSNTPNYDPKTDRATKDIKKGEEVLEDYRAVPNWELAHPWLML